MAGEADDRAASAAAEGPSTSGRDALSNENLPAAFWDALPADEAHPDMLAIKALQEESTLEERAETFKAQGNELLVRGMQLRKKFFVQQALVKYDQGLALLGKTADAGLKSTLLSNRAQAHLRLLNNRHALNDALAALDLNASNVKAAFRGATAASRLQEPARAQELCGRGLAAAPGDAELLKLSRAIEAKAAEERRQRELEAAKAIAARAPAKRLAAAVQRRGWRVGPAQADIGDCRPYLDADGTFHWPVVFNYPEFSERDIVQDFAETESIQEHLDVMFAADAPPPAWDAQRAYARERLEVFYLSNVSRPLSLAQLTDAFHSGWPAGVAQQEPERYGADAPRAVPVSQSAPLGQLLAQEACVCPGVPTFFVLARGTPYRQGFLERFS